MKKILVLLALVALMIGSLGRIGFASDANAFEDVHGALPAIPAD